MNRIVSTITLVSLICGTAVANVDGQLLCSHEDGTGHVIKFSEHEKEKRGECDHSHGGNESNACILNLSDAQGNSTCDDIEVPDSELGDNASNGDRLLAKSPAIILRPIKFSPATYDLQSSRFATPLRAPPCLESEARRFAKIVQIRC